MITNLTRSQRVEKYATGYCTVGTIGQVDETEKRIIRSYVGKIRGDIVTDKNGEWKFDTPEEARAAAQWFRQQARNEAGEYSVRRLNLRAKRRQERAEAK